MSTTHEWTHASSRTRRASLIAAVLGISLVLTGAQYQSDAETPSLMFRRIGANEATAVEVCRATVAAARGDMTRTSRTDPIARYAEALVDGARASSGPAHRAMPDDEPFRGYRFIVFDDGGITVVAYPAEYRSTGAMTFVVGPDGIVYERDLGSDTARIVRTLKARPASGWRIVDSGLT